MTDCKRFTNQKQILLYLRWLCVGPARRPADFCRSVFTADYCVHGESFSETMTHLDIYCRRVRVHNFSDADLGTFGRRFVLGSSWHRWTFRLTAAIGRNHCNLQGEPGSSTKHHPSECLPSLRAWAELQKIERSVL